MSTNVLGIQYRNIRLHVHVPKSQTLVVIIFLVSQLQKYSHFYKIRQTFSDTKDSLNTTTRYGVTGEVIFTSKFVYKQK